MDSARLILHGGVLALSLYVLAYLGLAWLDMAGSFYRPEVRVGYLFRGAAWLLGPHPVAFWDGVRPTPSSLFSHMIIEPLTGVPDRVDRGVLPRAGAGARNQRNYNSIRTMIRPSSGTSIAVGTTSFGSKKAY